ncbi:MAG: helix-turn-helix transcriptional regulator [Candidatus Cloacimonetes bacterium]|nr:helix-turn-helix transcriptional regulator [Candidatus Cloacimonadota bacterium]
MNFGDRVKRIRIFKGLTQKDLASKIGVRQTTVARYENNFTFPSQHVLATIATTLGVDTFWLIFGDDKDRITKIDKSVLETLKTPSIVKRTNITGSLRAPRIIKEIAKRGRDTGKDLETYTKTNDSEILNKLAFLEKKNQQLSSKIEDQKVTIDELKDKLIELYEKERK